MRMIPHQVASQRHNMETEASLKLAGGHSGSCSQHDGAEPDSTGLVLSYNRAQHLHMPQLL